MIRSCQAICILFARISKEEDQRRVASVKMEGGHPYGKNYYAMESPFSRTKHCSQILKVNLSAVNVSTGNCYPFLSTIPHARSILVLGMPNPCNWDSQVLDSSVWQGFVHFFSALFCLLFLLFGIVSIYLIVKRHKIDRFMVKTTVAVLITLAILGFSRAALSVLFSVVLEGKCAGESAGLACLILVRLTGAFGFPSLTASYSLVFLTLVLASKIRIGPDCLQKPRLLIPLSLVHYVIAIVFEVIGLVSPGPAVIALVVCESFYTLWGIIVCVIYMVIGIRLIKQIRHAIRTTSLMVRRAQKQRFSFGRKGTKNGRSQVVKLTRDVKIHHQRALRKVTIITYFAASLGIIYSLINAAMLVYTIIALNKLCAVLNDGESNNPVTWLVLMCVLRTVELLLGILLLYCITDISPFVEWFKRPCSKKDGAYEVSKPDGIASSESIPMDKALNKSNGHVNKDLEEKGNAYEQEEMICDLSKMSTGDVENSGSAETLQVDNVPSQIPEIHVSTESLSSSTSSDEREVTIKRLCPETVSLLVMEMATGDTQPNSRTRKMSCPVRPFSPTPLIEQKKSTTSDTQTRQMSLTTDMYAVIGVSNNDLHAAFNSASQEQSKQHRKVSTTVNPTQ